MQYNSENPILVELKKQTYLIKQVIAALEDKQKEDEYLTISDAAKFLHRSRSTIRRWIHENKIEGFKLNKGVMQDRYLIPKKSLEVMLKQNHL